MGSIRIYAIRSIAILFALLIMPAAGQPGSGRLLFTTSTGGSLAVVVQSDGAIPGTFVAAMGSGIYSSDWSPDGRSILLTRLENGFARLFVIDIESGRETRITSTGYVSTPRWSPDGSLVAYVFEANGESQFVVAAPDGRSAGRVLFHGRGWVQAWSPDSTAIAISVAGQGIFIVNVATLEAAQLAIPGFERQSIEVTDWSSGEIAFTHFADGGIDRIYIASIDGTNVRRAVQDDASHRDLRWSSDGSRFVFISQRDGSDDIYVADADGANIARLTDLAVGQRIVTLAYWTPQLDVRSVDGLPLDTAPLAELFESPAPVDRQNPASVAARVLSLMLDGTLDERGEDLVCPALLETYIDLSAAVKAEYELSDLSQVTYTVLAQDGTTAQIALGGTMSLMRGSQQYEFAASLIPLPDSPLAAITLVYDMGWRVCTPV